MEHKSDILLVAHTESAAAYVALLLKMGTNLPGTGAVLAVYVDEEVIEYVVIHHPIHVAGDIRDDRLVIIEQPAQHGVDVQPLAFRRKRDANQLQDLGHSRYFESILQVERQRIKHCTRQVGRITHYLTDMISGQLVDT